MNRRIMVPLDGSSFGERALPHAAALARRLDAGLELVHVHVEHRPTPDLEPITPYGYENIRGYDYADEERPARIELRELERLAERLASAYGIPAGACILRGHVAPALLRHAEQMEAELVVLATHARSGLRRVWLGSVGDFMLRHAARPVLLVRPGAGEPRLEDEPPVRRVLVPLDGSAFSEQIVERAGELLRRLDAPVTLLHVAAPLPDSITHHRYGRDEQIAQLRAHGEAYLADAVGRLRALLPVDDRAVVVHRSASAGIASYLSGRPFDLVAMTTHGRGGLSRLLMGSTADEVVHTIDVPLLAFRPSSTGAEVAASPSG